MLSAPFGVERFHKMLWLCIKLHAAPYHWHLQYPTLSLVMNADKPTSNHRFTVKEAAKRLNVSEAAIRQRIQRGSITYEKDEETNRVYIVLDDDFDRLDEGDTNGEPGYERELIDTLREQLAAEREANRENRRIIAALASRIPEIEAPSEPREAPLIASEGEIKSDGPPEEKQGFWRRFFFGE